VSSLPRARGDQDHERAECESLNAGEATGAYGDRSGSPYDVFRWQSVCFADERQDVGESGAGFAAQFQSSHLRQRTID